MEGSSAVLGFGVIEAVRVVFIAVVGPQVEVCSDLHLLGKQFEYVPLKQRLPTEATVSKSNLVRRWWKMLVPEGASSLFLQSEEIEVPLAHAPTRALKMSSGSISTLSPKIKENAPVRVLTRKLRSCSSWISSAACWFVTTPSASRRLN